MVNRLYNILIIIVAVILIESCAVLTPYKRPDQLPVDGLFRYFTEADTTRSFATVSVHDFYNDPLLQQLITEALDSNLNVRIAINRLAQMSELWLQRKAALYPTLNLGLTGTVSDVSKYGNGSKPDNPTTDLRLIASAGWEIDIWGRLSSLKKSQEALYLQQEATVRATQTQIVQALHQLIIN